MTFPLYILQGDIQMPNHCHNRVTLYSSGNDTDEARAQIQKIKQIFEDEECFTQIIPEPDWLATPLTDETAGNWLHSKRGEVGELPVKVEGDYGISQRFKSTNVADDRWYDWRLQNWDTKWDAYDVVVTDDDPDQLEVEFNTAWSPPEAICSALREQYPDLAISWFYDEPGEEIAGYL
tara:strand:+ start:47 stop:580 length:534 start_codon:yes stop_codon:yes gene_type:complete